MFKASLNDSLLCWEMSLCDASRRRVASGSCSYIASIHFFPFDLGHQVRHNYQCAPDLLLQQNKMAISFLCTRIRDLQRCFSSGCENPGIPQRSSCRKVRYGVVFLGFVRHSSPFFGTGRNSRDCLYILKTCMIEQSRSKDPWAAFSGNWAAWQRNQVRLW